MVRYITLHLQCEELAKLLKPWAHTSTPPDDPNLKLSLLNYISFISCSQDVYEAAWQNTRQCYPNIEILLHYRVERQAWILSGIITWEHHMCVRSCIGFTGPFAGLEHCPECGAAWYEDKELEESNGKRKVPQKVFTMFPVGPQLQAHWKHLQTAKAMHYWWKRTQKLQQERMQSGDPFDIYKDILCGESYTDLVDNSTHWGRGPLETSDYTVGTLWN